MQGELGRIRKVAVVPANSYPSDDYVSLRIKSVTAVAVSRWMTQPDALARRRRRPGRRRAEETPCLRAGDQSFEGSSPRCPYRFTS
jgi:hypothetical protein